MFKQRILVATDGSELSDKAAATAVELAQALGAELVAFTALPTYPYAGIGESSGVAAEDYQARAGAEASDRLARVEERARRGSQLPHLHARGRRALPRDRRCRGQARLRADRDGVARPAWCSQPRARERNAARSHAYAPTGARRALMALARSRFRVLGAPGPAFFRLPRSAHLHRLRRSHAQGELDAGICPRSPGGRCGTPRRHAAGVG